MSTDLDSIRAVSQMLIGNLLKSGRITGLTRDIIREQVVGAIGLLGTQQVDIDVVVEDLATRFDIFIKRTTILVSDDQHSRWVTSRDRSNWKFWARCEKYFLGQLPEPVVRKIDEDTDKILELIGDPVASGPWDRRGLVVGDVQSGKTSNYAALACKAADAGYKIIIVLAGIHESLRMQTQIRMDEAFLGFKTDHTRSHTGVGLFDPSVSALAATARSLRGDFNKIVAGQLAVPLGFAPPILLVVKKNAQMLKNLHSWLDKLARPLDDTAKHTIRSAPALVIDDESDNASVDTSEQKFDNTEKPDLDHQPTKINGLIRQILDVFEKKSYVGYTATPFANIFIHHEGKTSQAGQDLFPKHFVANMHAPSNYFGPVQAFGLDYDAQINGSALLRIIDESQTDLAELLAWLPPKHKQDHKPCLNNEDGFPRSLRQALLSFILVCAVRKLRGQSAEHNSMLIHVTRYTKIQAYVFEQVTEALVRIRRRLRYGDAGSSNSIRAELQKHWNEDFRTTTEEMRKGDFIEVGELPEWSQIDASLADVATGIRVKQINGLAQDVLDYDSFKNEGVDVIAIGGDKLSRGLTLYGLSVSYFTRQSDMYDTLLQMGRWFGYRPGYLDLCRLYTTQVLNDAFEHIATAADELRREFDYMEQIGKSPKDFGLKVLSHPILAPTSANKRRHARDIILYYSYAGGISEAKSFSLDSVVLQRNKAALDKLVVKLSKVATPQVVAGKVGEHSSSYLWKDMEWDLVDAFLQDYETEESAVRVDSNLWREYVREQIDLNGELAIWNVALLGGSEQPIRDVGPVKLAPRDRRRDKDVVQGAGYRIKRLLTMQDAGIDMTEEAWTAALKYDPFTQKGKKRTDPSAYGIGKARQEYKINPLLMIYLPQAKDMATLSVPVVGVAISFPGSDKAVKKEVKYTANTVFLETEDEDVDLE